MKFSILIANYNNGKYFKQCYDSIISQTYQDWEAIIVDDCSTDDSIKIIEKLIHGDSRFKLYKNDSNKGCGYSKRKTLEFANGEICGFLDPDDALTSNALKHSLEQFKNPKTAATYSKIMFCDADLNPDYDFLKVRQVLNDEYFFNCPIQIHHFFSFRKSAYDKTEGINPELLSAVDQDLYLKILEHGNAVFIPENMYFYRRHTSGISQDNSKAKAKENFAKVIFDTMKRRGLTKINGKKIPSEFTNSQEIFDLLDYQNGLPFRLKKKAKIFIQNLFS